MKESLRFLAKNPYAGKALLRDLVGFYSYRVRNFRIIYKVFSKPKLIKVIGLGPRKIIYEELERSIKSVKCRLAQAKASSALITMRQLAKRHTLDRLKIKNLIKEGRK